MGLEKSAVVVWVKKTDSFKAVKEQMASIANVQPDESTELKERSTSIGASIRARRPNGWLIRFERFRTSPKSSSCVCRVTMTPRPRSH